MDVRELQIGDWVKNDFGEIQRVVELRQDTVMLSYNDLFGYDKIEPVALTSEILEKNDWTYDGIYSYALWEDFMLEFYHHEGKFRVLWRDREVFCSMKGINYVHNFQHWLRLCGIDLDIQL